MFEKFRWFFKKDEPNEIEDDRYVYVPKSDINEELKRNIVELERLADELGKVLQSKYAIKFQTLGKHNLRIWVVRDIDGDVNEGLTSDNCLEKEYRSQIAIDFDGSIHDDYDEIELWYYFGGTLRGEGCGTLYNFSKYNLETEFEDSLKKLINQSS